VSGDPLTAVAVAGLPEIAAGDELADLIATRAELREGDVVAVAQKVVSKAEGRTRRLDGVRPSARALELAAELGKDPALVELILAESRRVVRAERGVLIVEVAGGHVCANAGIDSSNAGGDGEVVLLPADPDGSARRLRRRLGELSGAHLAVLITDSFGRPWRVGQSEIAIGCAGLTPLDDWRGRRDRDGRELAATATALADQAAGCADLARDKGSGEPVVVVRGLTRHVCAEDGPGAAALVRGAAEDLFR
jgi:coenzyme F420-0:L-glutamate ligase / coenzyme F420-1:gamma-L-glutamate ligase